MDKIFNNFIENFEEKTGKYSSFIYMVIYSLSCAVVNIFLKKLSYIPVSQKIFTITQFSFLFNLIAINKLNINPYQKNPKIHLVICFRGIIGCIGFFFYNYALEIISATELTVILFMSPIWAGILARIFLKEEYTIYEFISAIIGLIGLIIIFKPNFIIDILFPNSNKIKQIDEKKKIKGYLSVTFCSFCLATVMLLLRKIKVEGSSIIMAHSLFFCLLIISPLGIILFNHFIILKFSSYLISCFCGFLGIVLQNCIGRAIKKEKVAKVAIYSYLQIPIIIILELLFLGLEMKKSSIVGIAVILCSTLMVAFKNLIKS